MNGLITDVLFRGRPAWRISNREISLTIAKGGGHFAELKLLDGECPNLLWQPPWDTIDPQDYDEATHSAHFGGGSEAKLLSGILGHNLCFPFWGDPSAWEYAAGATCHGEANVVRWQAEQRDHSVELRATFPESRTRMRRLITLEGSHIHIQGTAENLSSWDRPVGWCEHVTFGPPFLDPDYTEFNAALGPGFITGKEEGDRFQWPKGKGTHEFDLRRFSSEPHSDLVNSFLTQEDAGSCYFRARNLRFGIVVEYRFSPSDFPWLNVWENNDERMQTRAMEFSNTPRHGTMKVLVQSPSVLNVPAYEWIDAGGALQKTFTISLARI